MMDDKEKSVSIVVKDFSLSLKRKHLLTRKVKSEVPLLRNVSAEIQGGQLVAIMGGSGIQALYFFFNK